MRIGEVASQAGVSPQTIRFYERTGVLAPAARTPSGYRDYGDDTLGRLAFVRAAQAVGLSLGERQLAAVRDELRRLATRASTLDPRQCDPARICHVIP